MELKDDLKLNFELINLDNKVKLDNHLKENPLELVLAKNKIDINNLILIEAVPINIYKLIEKIILRF